MKPGRGSPRFALFVRPMRLRLGTLCRVSGFSPPESGAPCRLPVGGRVGDRV